MTVVDNVTRMETAPPGLEIVRAKLTGATSTYIARMSRVISHDVYVEGTNGATTTISGKTITITGTNDDWVNIRVYGSK